MRLLGKIPTVLEVLDTMIKEDMPQVPHLPSETILAHLPEV
jgi:hypothetical protein